MLSEEQVKLLRKAISCFPGEPAAGAKWMLAIVLEDEPPDMPPVADQIKAVVPDEDAPCEMTKKQVDKMVADYEFALTATRERADRAELKVLEWKRSHPNG